MTYLIYSVQIEEEMRNREVELKLKLEKMMIHKVRCTWTLNVSASGSVIWLNGMEPGVPTNFNRTKISKHSVVHCEFVCFVQASRLPANFSKCQHISLTGWQLGGGEETWRRSKIVSWDLWQNCSWGQSKWACRILIILNVKMHFIKVHTNNFLVS